MTEDKQMEIPQRYMNGRLPGPGKFQGTMMIQDQELHLRFEHDTNHEFWLECRITVEDMTRLLIEEEGRQE